MNPTADVWTEIDRLKNIMRDCGSTRAGYRERGYAEDVYDSDASQLQKLYSAAQVKKVNR